MKRMNADNDAYKPSKTSRMKAKGKVKTIDYSKHYEKATKMSQGKHIPAGEK